MKQIYKSTKNIQKLLKKNNQGIKLDCGCGSNKQKGFVGMDIRPVEGVDIVHDIEDVPYPLPADCCGVILASHLVEHITPKKFLGVMDEWWRIMKTGGQCWISLPYGWSHGFIQDPTHCNPCNETTWTYFDPRYPLYSIYAVSPWKIIQSKWWEHGNMEVVLEKISIKEKDKILKMLKEGKPVML